MKRFFDEIIDIYKEVEKEIKEEVEKQKRLGQPNSSKKKTFNNKTSNNKKSFNKNSKINNKRKVQERVEGKELKDYKDFRTLRDVDANLDKKSDNMNKIGTRKSKLGQYSDMIDSQERIQEISENLLVDDLNKIKVIEDKKESPVSKDIEDIINSLRTKDKLKNARKAFLYSEIFNRKTW